MIIMLNSILIEDKNQQIFLVKIGPDQVEEECAKSEIYSRFVAFVQVEDEIFVRLDF
jgi:hypothetical protein